MWFESRVRCLQKSLINGTSAVPAYHTMQLSHTDSDVLAQISDNTMLQQLV